MEIRFAGRGAVLLACLVAAVAAPAQTLSSVPLDLEVPFAALPFASNGKTHLVYELHITNFRSGALALTRAEVFGGDRNGAPLASYADKELLARLERPGAGKLPDKRVIGGGMRAVLFLWITVDSPAAVPATLRHRLFATEASKVAAPEHAVEGAVVAVQRGMPAVIGPPLRGEGWLFALGGSNGADHRRSIMVVNGKARLAQRFAGDWIRLGPDGRPAHGDASQNGNWYSYGAEALAVADALVADVKDGLPENVPESSSPAKYSVPITVETATGNYVTLDLGNGRYAVYAHLQPKSIRVRVGDRVRRGDVLALVGNTGLSDAPHLHFQIVNANLPLASEGLPYLLESFDVRGALPSLEALESGWRPPTGAAPERRKMEMPFENAVIRFP